MRKIAYGITVMAAATLLLTGCGAKSLPLTPENAPQGALKYEGCMGERISSDSQSKIHENQWYDAYEASRPTEKGCESLTKAGGAGKYAPDSAYKAKVTLNGMTGTTEYPMHGCKGELKLTDISFNEKTGVKYFRYSEFLTGDTKACFPSYYNANRNVKSLTNVTENADYRVTVASGEKGDMSKVKFERTNYNAFMPREEMTKFMPSIYFHENWEVRPTALAKGQEIDFVANNPLPHKHPAIQRVVIGQEKVGSGALSATKTTTYKFDGGPEWTKRYKNPYVFRAQVSTSGHLNKQ